MGDYLEAYAAHFELPVRTSTAVDALWKEGDRYVVTAGAQTFEADNVVVASGVMQKPFVPSFAPELDPRIRQLHSNDYRNLSQLQEGSVLVVGASHSGADIAYEAAAEHETILSGPDTGQIPASVETRRGARRLSRAVLPRLARPHDGHATSAARCDRTSGTAALRSCATGRRICSPPGSSAFTRGWSASRTACPCSTTVASSTSRT